MKKWLVLFFIGVFSGMVWCPLSRADDAMDKSTTVEADDAAASQDKAQSLKDKYKVSDDTINNLRDKKLGYGEVDTVLGLASQMPDGITDRNIQKVIELRQGDGSHKMGWGNVAKELGLKMGDIKGDKISGTPPPPEEPTITKKKVDNTLAPIEPDPNRQGLPPLEPSKAKATPKTNVDKSSFNEPSKTRPTKVDKSSRIGKTQETLSKVSSSHGNFHAGK